MKSISIKLIVVFILFQSLNCSSQTLEKDSVEMTKIATGFFD